MSASAADPSELVGAILDRRWRIVRYVGSGAIGIVYEAEGLGGEGSRAIKLLRSEFIEEVDVVQRFLDEARASSRVDHPGIAKVFEARRSDDGTPYLVMEMLRGMPLYHRMNRGRLPVEQAAPIAFDLLDALQAAHEAGVVHRDLKPENVFLERADEGTITVKLLDLGIARVMDVAGGATRRTQTGMLLGTPGYMSPEQVQNAKQSDARSDLWAVGVLFYEMLTGRRAFEADNEFARMIAVLNESPTPIEEVAPQYAHWSPFFGRALAREAGARFQTAREMADALRAVAREGQMPTSQFAAIRMSDPPPLQTPAAPVDPPGQAAVSSPQTSASASPRQAAAPPRQAAAPASLPGPSANPTPFGSADTAVSAGAGAPAGPVEARPSVEVVVSRRRGIPLAWVLVMLVVALALGFAAGFVVGGL